MPDFCTCGAQLPPDARFCHKCGKPQREEPVFEPDEPREPEAEPVVAEYTPPELPPEPASIGLRNKFAVRAGAFAGLAAFFVGSLMGPLAILGILGSGVFAVYLYRRSTGQGISVLGGGKLGWIAGMVLFVFVLLNFTISAALDPNFLETMRQEMLKQSTLTEAEAHQVTEFLHSGLGMVVMVITMFLASTLLPAIGGAVGAKLLGRRPADHPNA